jgi:hypothetical protein
MISDSRPTVPTNEPRPLHQIASEITKDWKKVNYAAAPYLRAMGSLHSIYGNFGAESAESIVLYFLCNARGWRGEVARRVKLELKTLIKEK